jgi:hypothetical protein
MSKQPEALRLADALETEKIGTTLLDASAAELRRLYAQSEMRRLALLEELQKSERLHSVNSELLDALKLARLIVNPAHAYGIAIHAAITKAQE